MLKKTITYTDYNGVVRTEDHYFNLSKAEIVDMENATPGGYSAMLQGIVDAKDQPALIKHFKELVLKAYGIKSPDGRRFIKSQAIREEFEQTEAFVELYMELVTNDKAAAEFTNGIIPKMDSKQPQ
jgi:hypothetical protein